MNVLCLKFEDNQVKVSRLLAAKNLLYFPLLLTIRICFPMTPDSIRKESELRQNQGLSILFFVAFSFRNCLNVFLYFIFIYLQFGTRNRILKLIQRCIRFYNQQRLYDDRQFDAFERNFFRRFFTFIGLVSFLNFLEFVTILNFTWEAVLIFLLYSLNGFLILYILSLIYCFLRFFELVLRNLNDKLEDTTATTNISDVIIVINSLKHLTLEFRKSLGSQLTLVVVSVITTQTIRVSVWINFEMATASKDIVFRLTSSFFHLKNSHRWIGKVASWMPQFVFHSFCVLQKWLSSLVNVFQSRWTWR